MSVEHVSSLREFENIKSNSGNLLVVVDFHATWCGPCHAIAPFFEQLASRYARRARFLKVDVDDAQEIAQSCGITAMPTFQFYLRGSAVAETRGANKMELESNVERFAPSAASVSFSGSGHTLGSSSSDGRPRIDWDAAAPKDSDAAKSRREAMAKAAAARASTSAAEEPSTADTGVPDEVVAVQSEAPATEVTEAQDNQDNQDNQDEQEEENDPRLKVDAALLSQMEEMGFPRIRAQKALIFTGNKSLEPAMEWCFVHSDDADIDEPLSLVSKDGTPKTQLSEEQKKKKADEVLRKARAKRQEMEKKDEAQREKDRIRSGKEIANARRTIEEQERQRAVALKRKEKLDAIAERKRVKELLEADKQRRRERFNMGAPSNPPPVQTVPKPAAASSSSPPSGGKIQLRLQDGSRLEQNFEPDQVLNDVVAFIVSSRPELGGRTLGFSQQYPRRVFTESDYETSLAELSLLPRGALNVTFK